MGRNGGSQRYLSHCIENKRSYFRLLKSDLCQTLIFLESFLESNITYNLQALSFKGQQQIFEYCLHKIIKSQNLTKIMYRSDTNQDEPTATKENPQYKTNPPNIRGLVFRVDQT